MMTRHGRPATPPANERIAELERQLADARRALRALAGRQAPPGAAATEAEPAAFGGGCRLRETGIEAVGAVPWGTHFCQFYETREDLVATVAPFLRAGLGANELCMWVVPAGMEVADAAAVLHPWMPGLDEQLSGGRLLLARHDEVYTAGGQLDVDAVVKGWLARAALACDNGFDGLRLSGDTMWLEQHRFEEFACYEAVVDGAIGGQRMLALCTYPLARCSTRDLLDVVANHEFALISRGGAWELIETSAQLRLGDALRHSEERYRALFEAITEGFALHEILCDEQGEPCDYRFLELNPAFEDLTGLRRAEIVGRTVREVLPAIEPRWIEIYGAVALSGEPTRFEQHAAAMGRDFEVRAFCPRVGQFATLFTDVSERNRVARSLAASQRDLSRAQQVARVGSWRLDADADQLRWSDEAYRIFAVPLGTPVSYEDFLALVHPDDRGRAVSEWQAATAGAPFDVEHRVVVDGAVKWVRERGELEIDPGGVVVGAFGTIQDITQAKEATQQLEVAREEAVEERNRLEAVMAALPAGVAIVDSAEDSVLANRAYDEILRGPRPTASSVDEDRGLRVWWVEDGRPVEPSELAAARAVVDGETVTGQMLEIERFDGTRAVIHNSAAPFFDAEGRIAGAAVAILDLSELKEKERELELVNERLVRAQRSARVGIWEWDVSSGQLAWSAELFRLFGLDSGSAEASVEAWRAVVDPDDLNAAEERMEAALRDHTPLDSEYRVVTPGGGVRWINALGDTIYDEQGSARRMAGICIDVTARKQVEEELRASEARFRALAEALPQFVWTADAGGRVDWLNRRWYDFVGPTAGGEGEGWQALCHPDDMARTVTRWQRACDTGSVYENELRIRRHDGEYRWFLARGWPMRDGQGTVIRWFGSTTDIHELKAAEQAVRESREDLNRAQSVAALGSWRLDVQRDELLWSDEAWRIFGVPRETHLSYETFLAAVHPDDRARVDGAWSAALRGEAYDIEHRIVCGDTVKWVRERAELERDADGTVVGGFGTSQDITARRQDEERLRAALREKEVLLQELHHRVKNNLQIIASMLNLQLAGISDEELRGPLLESQNRVKTLALIHEMLYSSTSFTEIAMGPYVAELVAAVQQSFGAACRLVRVELDVEEVELAVGTAIPVALILNELLTNAFKHAFPGGRQGRVFIVLRRRAAGRLCLTVSDDGVGVPPELDVHSTPSMGLQLVSVLTTQLDGVCELRRADGTTFMLELAEDG